jgi:hypothetical protein
LGSKNPYAALALEEVGIDDTVEPGGRLLPPARAHRVRVVRGRLRLRPRSQRRERRVDERVRVATGSLVLAIALSRVDVVAPVPMMGPREALDAFPRLVSHVHGQSPPSDATPLASATKTAAMSAMYKIESSKSSLDRPFANLFMIVSSVVTGLAKQLTGGTLRRGRADVCVEN